MTFPVLSLLRHRRNILIFAFVLAAVGGVATPSLRARFSEVVLGQPPVPNLDQTSAMLDPASLKTGGQPANSLGKRPAITGMGTADLVAGGIQGRSASSAATSKLKLESAEDVDGSASQDIPRDADSKDVAALLSHDIKGGLGSIPSPISGRSHNSFGGGAGGGMGMPGGFSSGLRSDFNHGDPLDDGRKSASGKQDSNAKSSASTTAIVTRTVKFDPNKPFGKSDLTKMTTDGTDIIEREEREKEHVAAAPIPNPEPGTLLLIGTGVATLGSRFLRRKRNR